MASERWLTVEEVADQLSVTAWTVRHWLKQGKLKGTQMGSRRAGWRIPESEIRRLLRLPSEAPKTDSEK